MASGSFNIDTYSWYRSLPLSNDTTAYPFLTMFAVGPSSFEAAYSFSNYQSACGYCNTIELSNILTSNIDSNVAVLNSNINQGLTSTLNFIGKIYQSTFPATTFQSSYNTFTTVYGPNAQFVSPPIQLGNAISSLIQSKQYNAFMEFQYNIYLSSPYDVFTFVSTTGYIGSNTGVIGRSIATRVGDRQYQTIRQELTFKPQTNSDGLTSKQFGSGPSSFQFVLQFQSTSAATSNLFPAFDIYIPGENNYTLTLVPVTSTVIG